MAGERATATQLRVLAQIQMLSTAYEGATNGEGFLSVLTGNLAATRAGLVRRGWVTATELPGPTEEERDWEYRLTDAGRELLAESEESETR